MSDLISRQAAIDATWFEPSYTDPLNVLTEARDRLKALPSVQPERKKGKWKGYNEEKSDWQRTDGSPVFLICSECGAIVVNNFAAKWRTGRTSENGRTHRGKHTKNHQIAQDTKH